MFQKLFSIVKSNADQAVIQNPAIPAKHRESVINEASSSIIEVLKGQMESGQIKNLIKFFQLRKVGNSAMVTSIVNKFANRLNKFYDIDPASAQATAVGLIPPVMQQFVQQSQSGSSNEMALSSILSTLNGNQADLSTLVRQLMTIA